MAAGGRLDAEVEKQRTYIISVKSHIALHPLFIMALPRHPFLALLLCVLPSTFADARRLLSHSSPSDDSAFWTRQLGTS